MRHVFLAALAGLALPGAALSATITLGTQAAVSQFGDADELVIGSEAIDAGAPAVSVSSQSNETSAASARATPDELTASAETRNSGITLVSAGAGSQGVSILFDDSPALRALAAAGAIGVDLLFHFDVAFDMGLSPFSGTFTQSFARIDVNLGIGTALGGAGTVGTLVGTSGAGAPPSFSGQDFLAGVGAPGTEAGRFGGSTTTSLLASVAFSDSLATLVFSADASALALSDPGSAASVTVGLPDLSALVTTTDGRSLASLGVTYRVLPALGGPVEPPPPAPIPLPAGVWGLLAALAALGAVARRRGPSAA